MKKIFLTVLIGLNCYASDFQSHFFVNGEKAGPSQHTMIKPNTPTLIEVYFSDPRNGETYKDFKVMHGKYMHMVIANKDLSVFKHIHPYFDPVTGRFAITVNLPYSDPDNQDASHALQKPGMFMIMTDVIVKGVGMRMDHTMIHVMGPTTHSPLILDQSSEGVITKYFYRGNESIPTYKTVFSKNTISGCSGSLIQFEIEMFHYQNNRYEPLLDFQPWLKEAAHAVWLSEGYMKHMHHNMPFAHMHSPFAQVGEEGKPRYEVYDHILRFNFHDQRKMLRGAQKMWIQFKHEEKIMKIPFVFEYEPIKNEPCENES